LEQTGNQGKPLYSPIKNSKKQREGEEREEEGKELEGYRGWGLSLFAKHRQEEPGINSLEGNIKKYMAGGEHGGMT